MTTLEMLFEAEEKLGNNLQWLNDQLDLAIRQGDKETLKRLAEIREAWKLVVGLKARQKIHDGLMEGK